tara:strand:+ start:118 stop:546 length:429 start_codon:yes stop_codon:yes gene_type:complete
MSDNQNISQMLVDISGDLLQSVGNKQEMQSRLDIVIVAWNMSLHSRLDRPLKLKRFLRKQKGQAPSKEALKALESEIKKIIKHKDNLYPDACTELVRAEAVQQTNESYEIKVFFKDKDEEAKLKQAQYSITRFNEQIQKDIT